MLSLLTCWDTKKRKPDVTWADAGRSAASDGQAWPTEHRQGKWAASNKRRAQKARQCNLCSNWTYWGGENGCSSAGCAANRAEKRQHEEKKMNRAVETQEKVSDQLKHVQEMLQTTTAEQRAIWGAIKAFNTHIGLEAEIFGTAASGASSAAGDRDPPRTGGKDDQDDDAQKSNEKGQDQKCQENAGEEGKEGGMEKGGKGKGEGGKAGSSSV